ncbi:MAG: hypothetical protein ACOH2A_05070 [Sphingobacteriaceae bacterium]
MKKFTSLLLLTINFLLVFGQEKDPKHQQVVLDFIKYVKNQDKEKLSDLVAFPLSRKYPLSVIENKQGFLDSYSEIFDDRLVKMILNANLLTDWSSVGYRGIMFLDGKIWLDYDGRLKAVNYQSAIEKTKRAELISIEKLNLHKSIKTFSEPVIQLETTKYSIRIDDLGAGNYRYASWAITSKKSEKPDLVLEQGELMWEGSGGNHRYVFNHGDYVYYCLIMAMKETDAPMGILKIFKNNQEILKQDAHIITK